MICWIVGCFLFTISCYSYRGQKSIVVWKQRTRGENVYHHIYARGNDRHPVFKNECHHQKYLFLLEKYAFDFDVDVIAYAMMETHVHLFVYDRFNNISDFMMKLHGDYARYYNRIGERVGHVFGERFNNKIVAVDIYGKWLSRYIHRQAVEAGLVEDPVDFPWSSYRVYLGLEKSNFVKSDVILGQFGTDDVRVDSYRAFVHADDNGPVDWSKRYLLLVGGDDLIAYVCQKLNLEMSVLKHPQGMKQRNVRHRAIRTLHREYGYQPYQLARVFGLARCTVAGIIKERNVNEDAEAQK